MESKGPFDPANLTQLLERLGDSDGRDPADWNRLFDLVYDELYRLADLILLPSERDRTISPTVLIHEAYLHLGGSEKVSWENRAHFFGIAARAMRQVLARHSRRAQSAKRGGGWERISLCTSLESKDERFDFFELNDALDKLAAEHDRMAQVCELRFFGGMSSPEIAEILGVSRRTVDGDWSLARKWLARELA